MHSDALQQRFVQVVRDHDNCHLIASIDQSSRLSSAVQSLLDLSD